MELFANVQLITDKYKDKGASKGDIGVIVEIWHHKGIPTGYEVAFTDSETGVDYARFAVQDDEIMVID